MSYDGAEQQLCKVSDVESSIMEKLTTRKSRLEKQLADIQAAIDALTANPETAKVLELVGRASRY